MPKKVIENDKFFIFFRLIKYEVFFYFYLNPISKFTRKSRKKKIITGAWRQMLCCPETDVPKLAVALLAQIPTAYYLQDAKTWSKNHTQ